MLDKWVAASHLVLTLEANVDNEKLTDSEFRAFVRNSLSICKEVIDYQRNPMDIE